MTSGDGTFFASASFPIDPLSKRSGATCTFTSGRDTATGVSSSAGDIVIEVPSKNGTQTSTLKFDASKKSYDPTSLDAPADQRLEMPGAPIHVSAKGAAIPAFEANVAAAYDTSLVEPAKDAVISATSGDLLVRWTDAGNEVVFATLEVGSASVACRFEASAKEGTIPAALVEQALESARTDPASCAGACTRLVLTALRTTELTAGDYLVLVSHAVGDVHELKSE
jgi:hypothetical protein